MPGLSFLSWPLGQAEGQADAAQPNSSALSTVEADKTVSPSSQQPEVASSSARIPVIAQEGGGADSGNKSNDYSSDAAEPQFFDKTTYSVDAGKGALICCTEQPKDIMHSTRLPSLALDAGEENSAHQQQRMEGSQPSNRWLFSNPMMGYFRPSERATGDSKTGKASKESSQPSPADMAGESASVIADSGESCTRSCPHAICNRALKVLGGDHQPICKVTIFVVCAGSPLDTAANASRRADVAVDSDAVQKVELEPLSPPKALLIEVSPSYTFAVTAVNSLLG